MQQEELARLFSANMSLSEQQTVAQQQVSQPAETPNPQPITYISQHYTHSYHVVPACQPTQEAQKTQIDVSELQAILIRHSIDPESLFPSQVDLFKNADDDQRLRLLELWRISPPQGRQGIPNSIDYNMSRQLYDWPPTSVAQEEAMAKLRYEKMMEERAQAEEIQRHEEQLVRSMEVIEVEPPAIQATRGLLASSTDSGNAEPYILSGYEMMARREYDQSAKAAENPLGESTKYNQATDPVYSSQSSGLWQKNVGSLLDMENQYGAFTAAREQEGPHIYGDYEMVM